jgi:hypothetical protein
MFSKCFRFPAPSDKYRKEQQKSRLRSQAGSQIAISLMAIQPFRQKFPNSKIAKLPILHETIPQY